MKPTTAFALVASILPFAVAMPYNAPELAERDAAVDVAWVTDVEVATVVEQVTLTYTGEPAAVETVVSLPPVTTSSAAPVQTSIPAHNRQHDGNGRGRRSTVQYTIEKTTSSVSAPTSTVAPPPPPPAPTTESIVALPPVPTTLITIAPPPVPVTTSSIVQAPVSVDVSTGKKNSFGLDLGPDDYAAEPKGYPNQTETPAHQLSSEDFKSGILSSANSWRAKWGAGPLVWDDSLAEIAHTSVFQECDLSKAKHTGAQNFGQGTGLTPAGANSEWGSEAENWRWSLRDGSSSPATKPGDDGTVGHFTQLVWKETKKVGCAVRDCSTEGGKYNPYLFIACNYDTGNVRFNFVDQVNSLPLY